MSTIDDVPPIPKIEHFEDESFSESSPEPEEQSLTQEPAQVQKRKGGRKPVWPAFMHVRTYMLPNPILDLRDIGRTQATESPSSGSFQGTANGVYQATRNYYQTA